MILYPNSSNHFLSLTAIQGHSGDYAIDLELQDNVLLPKGFTEYIYHAGDASGMNSIIRRGSILGGRSLKRGRQSVFFTVTNPTEDDNGMEETPCDLSKARNAPFKTLGNLFKFGILVQFKTHSGERIAILPNTITRNCSLKHTARRLHLESGMYETEGGALPKRYA